METMILTQEQKQDVLTAIVWSQNNINKFAHVFIGKNTWKVLHTNTNGQLTTMLVTGNSKLPQDRVWLNGMAASPADIPANTNRLF